MSKTIIFMSQNNLSILNHAYIYVIYIYNHVNQESMVCAFSLDKINCNLFLPRRCKI